MTESSQRVRARGASLMSSGEARRWIDALEIDTRLLAMIGTLVVIGLFFNVATGGLFLSPRNLYNLTLQTSVVAIMACGMVIVIVSRHIDLSVGSLMGMLGVLAAVVQVHLLPTGAWFNWIVSLVVALSAGALIGAFQGYWVAYRRLPSFIVTLAGLLAWRGGAWLLAKGTNISPMDERFQMLGGGLEGAIGPTWSWVFGIVAIVGWTAIIIDGRARRSRLGLAARPFAVDAGIVIVFAAAVIAFVMTMNSHLHPIRKTPMGIPIPVLILSVVVVIISVMATMTKFGRYIYGIGGNPEAAELAGVNVKLVTMLIFVVMGVLCGLSACVSIARLNAAPTSLGEMEELSVIAAAVIGGASLAGGVGTAAGAIIGALIMQSLRNGMVLIGIQSSVQQLILALVLILAVWFDVSYQQMRKR
ncbi:MAG: sugar ABC transporter permease [Bauldia sp.]